MTTKTKSKTKTIVPIEEVVESVIVEQEVEVIPPPKMFSIYQMPKDGAELPESPNPYYPFAKEGLYLYKKLLIGHGFVPQKFVPKTLASIGEDRKDGEFWWKAPKIPAEVCASIYSFFKRIYEKQKTEAEVLLLLNHKTLEWKVFIPTQEVSHAGVKSVYEPADLPKDYVLVGSMHSHCDFGAFHSGTDTTDAAEFDGVHLTIGKIMSEKPEIVAMVMMNKVQFNFSVDTVADFSSLDAAVAPEEWDEFVTENSNLVSGHKPKGYELFNKYANKKPVTSVIPYVPDSKFIWTNGTLQRDYRIDYGLNDEWTAEELDLWDEYFEKKYPQLTQKDTTTEDIIGRYTKDYWEDALPDKLADVILDSITLQEKDIDHVMENYLDGISYMFWKNLYIQKMADVANVLNALNIDVTYHLKPKKYTKDDN